ncbi:MAG: hypothetical protein Q7N87_02955 [Candidatus Uhrbacteria bacterium]|nr:hypothetical protein [Candidatus Uhrbacteria bacterium]
MKRILFPVFFVTLLLSAGTVFAAMTSTNFKIQWDNTNEGGSDVGVSANFSLVDTVGDLATGTSTSANFQVSAGYRAEDTVPALSLVIKTQDLSTQTFYTDIDVTNKTVTVPLPGAFSVGDYMAVVENRGFSEKVVVGRIVSIVGTTITVDGFDGATGSMSAHPTDGRDSVYRLSGNSAGFGTIAVTSQNTSVTMTSVRSSLGGGYTVYLQADKILQSLASQPIATVADGAVNLDSEEYGASTTGTRAYQPDTDAGVTTTQRIVQTGSSFSASPADRVVIIYKLAITNATNPGTYSHNVFYTLTANF